MSRPCFSLMLQTPMAPPEGLLRQEVMCPYCGEHITAEAEPEAGDHRFVEDCPVCCRPIEYVVFTQTTGRRHIHAGRDDDG